MINAQRTRKEYTRGSLDFQDLAPHPVEQFREWFETAVSSFDGEANAMTLATASADAIPSARMVLLKSFDPEGFVFVTNYLSQKGKELSENPRAALVFYWGNLERQIRIEGEVTKTSDRESDEIFESRPVGSRIAATLSNQSEPISSRTELETAYEKLSAGPAPERPSHWGGYRIRPIRFEFWQGGENRLHDRFQYVLTDDGWIISRLQP